MSVQERAITKVPNTNDNNKHGGGQEGWTNSQCSQNKHGCQMDLNDHVEVLVHKSVHHVAHEDKHPSGKIDLHEKLVFVDLKIC